MGLTDRGIPPARLAPGYRAGVLWPGNWPERAADMLRADLERAGIPFVTPAGRLDAHALRTTYVTLLARAGVSLVAAQKLARHSTPNLTANVYSRLSSGDLAAGNWQPIAVPVGDPVPLAGGLERVTYRDTTPLGGQTRRFIRATARK